MLKTINGNLCFKSFITFVRVLLPDPNNKNSLAFTRVPFFRGLHKHFWPFEENIGLTPASVGKLRLGQGSFLKPREAASSPSGLALAFQSSTMGFQLPVDICPSAWFIHMAEWEQTPQSPQRQNHFKHRVAVKQLSRKADLGCLVLPAQLSHSGAPSSVGAGSFWSDHAVALWQ